MQALLLFCRMFPAQLRAFPAPSVSPDRSWPAALSFVGLACPCRNSICGSCARQRRHLALCLPRIWCCSSFHLQAAGALGPQPAADHGNVAGQGATHLFGACARHARLCRAGRLCCHANEQGGLVAHTVRDAWLSTQSSDAAPGSRFAIAVPVRSRPLCCCRSSRCCTTTPPTLTAASWCSTRGALPLQAALPGLWGWLLLHGMQ